MFLNFWKKGIKEKRAHERIQTHLDVKVLNGGSPHNGLVTNLSEEGMCFITGSSISSGLNIELTFSLEENHLKVPVKIIRTKKTGSLYDEFGAELSNSNGKYLEFVNRLRTKL